MKLLKFAFIGLFATFSLLLSVSCSDSNDIYVKEGILSFTTEDFTVIPETESDGIWEGSVSFRLSDITNLYADDRLEAIEIYQSIFELLLPEGYHFRIGDDIIIKLQNDNGEPLSIHYVIERSGINSLYIDDEDEEYYYFVRAFFEMLYRKGSVKLYITVDMLDRLEFPIGGLPFDIRFDNDLNLYVRR